MPARIGPGFEHEDLFREYCITHGVANADGNYASVMNTMAAQVDQRLGPTMIRSETDVWDISARITSNRFSPSHHTNFRSVLRKYLAMVRENFRGQFGAHVVQAVDVDVRGFPARVQQEISRVVRDTVMSRNLKLQYEGQCQVCGGQLPLPNGAYYLEGHHLKPLGRPHNGPDVPENIICVCPNCHVLLDFGMHKIRPRQLAVSRHALGREFIDYHNDRCS